MVYLLGPATVTA